jgi:hypothetical protein
MSYFDLKKGDLIPETGRVIKEIISADQTFIVYIDDSDIICWTTSPDHTQYGKDFGYIENQISHWESICNRLFIKKEAFDYKTLLAEGYARMLDSGNDDDAIKIINDTADRIKLQGDHILKQSYLLASLASTILVTILLILFVLEKTFICTLVEKSVYQIFVAGFFGGIGSFVSCMIKVNNYVPELTSGKRIHQIDGVIRIIYGLLSGVIVALGIKANIIFGFVDSLQKNIYILYFLGAISGASEFLLPNIIKQFDNPELAKINEKEKKINELGK